MEALLISLVHTMMEKTNAEPITVGAIAKRFSELYQHEFRRPITSRLIGSLLRRLGITTYKRHGHFAIEQGQSDELLRLIKRHGLSEVNEPQSNTEL